MEKRFIFLKYQQANAYSLFFQQSPSQRLPSGADLGESGYFASETMSVSNDPASEPLSSHYLANSGSQMNQGSPTGTHSEYSPEMDPRERSRTGSLLEARLV